MRFSLFSAEEIFSVTTQAIQSEEIEHEEEVVQHHPANIESTTICMEEGGTAAIIEEEEDETVYTLELSDDSDGEDKMFLGKMSEC